MRVPGWPTVRTSTGRSRVCGRAVRTRSWWADPLGGLLLDITGWTPQEVATGAALMTELGQFDADGRALCWSRPEGAGR